MKRNNYIIMSLVMLLCITITQSVNAQSSKSRYASQSVLHKGKWVKIRVKDNGIYKLSYDDIKKMGFEDPSKVKIYGYGGWKLEELFTKPYIDDLPEVPVWKSSQSGFKSGDYLLFYARGVIKWNYQTVSNKNIFAHENNPYDTYGYYFLGESNNGAKVMEEEPMYSGTTEEVTVFDDYLVHERDSIALLNSGRELFGESFTSNRSRNFDFNIPGITADPGFAYLSFAGAPGKKETASLSIDGNKIVTADISKPDSYYKKAHLGEAIGNWNGTKKENFRINISYTATSGVAYLNFIALNFKRKLQFYNQPYTFFRHTSSRTSSLRYVIGNASANCMIWDVSDPLNVKQMKTTLQGSQMIFAAASGKGSITEYVMVDPSKSFQVPVFVETVENRDLHGSAQVDMVIIAPKAYFTYAEQLAAKHREKQKLEVLVVEPSWIFNEFSSGTRDATAYRRFMKMFYDRARLEGKTPAPKYLLLYGDGFFDNRHLTAEGKNRNSDNYLLTYQFKNSLDERVSYGTDDYFGFLDDNEGGSLGVDKLDLGIGRLPVSSEVQAKNAMEKIINYMDNGNYGKWRNSVIFTADDTGDDSFCLHAGQANDLAKYVESNRPEYIISKSYMDAFQRVDLNGKTTYPDAKNKLFNTLKEGCLLFNYTGHGSPTGLSGEDMMNVTDIRQMGFENLPLWITATCDFGWFDGTATSAGEEVFLNKKSGGIALYTTTRVVYASNNFTLNTEIIKSLFPSRGNKYPTLGDAFKEAKSKIDDLNKLNFILLGDPALVLNYPQEQKVVLESISVNGEQVDMTQKLNFRALDEVLLQGSVVDSNGKPMNDFNGNLYVTAFDGKQTIKVLEEPENEDSRIWSFEDYQNKIYVGNNEVKEGGFAFSFKVPLDISYNSSNKGKMNFYAWDAQTGTDAIGTFLDYTLSGSNGGSGQGEGPEIREIYLNSKEFQNGGTVHETPYFYAEVYDEDGINMAGTGVGHDITISIDQNPAWTYNLNSYYQSINSSQGSVGFAIPELPAGEHQLVFRIWDILNNSSTDTLAFKVVMGSKPAIYDIRALPNPASLSAEFVIEHDRPETSLEVEVRVFDLTGRTVWTHQATGPSADRIDWDLVNNLGQRVQAGVYLYQAVISANGGKEATKSKKIIVLKQ
ncbi:MAG: type IX secretion system sortase PorU [Bacteroidales bacterium]|nr:type IX secretion system sortase PorU [Bacteroidales bacterium]